jgi:hypothetical protein
LALFFINFNPDHDHDHDHDHDLLRFYPRWKEWETRQAQELSFSLADSQWDADWADLLRYFEIHT